MLQWREEVFVAEGLVLVPEAMPSCIMLMAGAGKVMRG